MVAHFTRGRFHAGGIAALGVVLALLAAPAGATMRCGFDSYSGAIRKEIAPSWLGSGFELDLGKAELRRIYGDKATKWFAVTVLRAEDPISVQYKTFEKVNGNHQFEVQWRFRIEDDGRCEARIGGVHQQHLTARGKLLD
jgi:hypothetical protein